jgi:hypothetical protein
MTRAQHKHVSALLREFRSEGYRKYRRGCNEHAGDGHNGNLWEIPLLELMEHLIEEVLDLWMYAGTVRAKMLSALTAAHPPREPDRRRGSGQHNGDLPRVGKRPTTKHGRVTPVRTTPLRSSAHRR